MISFHIITYIILNNSNYKQKWYGTLFTFYNNIHLKIKSTRMRASWIKQYNICLD